jgi:hypothetical protein
MPITVNWTQSCTPSGGIITIQSITSDVTGTGSFTWHLRSDTGIVMQGTPPGNAYPVNIGPLANAEWTLFVVPPASGGIGHGPSEPEVIVINCNLVSVLAFDAGFPAATDQTSVGTNSGIVRAQASGGTPPYTTELLELQLSQPTAGGQLSTFPNIPVGIYTVRVTDSGIPAQQIQDGVTVHAFEPVIERCTDEAALNYGAEGACDFGPRWRSAWQPVAVPTVATLPVPAYLEAELWCGFPAGHSRASLYPLALLTTVRATTSPGGVATFNLGPFLRPLLGAADGAGGRRLDLNSAGAFDDDLYMGYELRLDGVLIQRGLVINAAVPDDQLMLTNGGIISPFAARLPLWPGFEFYTVTQLVSDMFGKSGALGTKAAGDYPGIMLPCPSHPLPVAWLAPGGSYGYWVFNGKPKLGDSVGEGSLYGEATTRERRYCSRGEGLRTIEASSGVFVGEDWAEALRTLRHSPQAWYQPGGFDTPWVPIVLGSGQFDAGRMGQRRREFLISFSEAQPVLAQGQ